MCSLQSANSEISTIKVQSTKRGQSKSSEQSSTKTTINVPSQSSIEILKNHTTDESSNIDHLANVTKSENFS